MPSRKKTRILPFKCEKINKLALSLEFHTKIDKLKYQNNNDLNEPVLQVSGIEICIYATEGVFFGKH